MVRRTGEIFAGKMYIEKWGGAGTGPGEERGSWQQCAAVHRHSLDRLNTINDSLKKETKGRDPAILLGHTVL